MSSVNPSQGITLAGRTIALCLLVGAIAACLWLYPAPVYSKPAPASPAGPTSDPARSTEQDVRARQASPDKNEANTDTDIDIIHGLGTKPPDTNSKPAPARPTSDHARSACQGVRLCQVNPDKNEADTDIDIIAIHGLDTKSPDTWTWVDPSDRNNKVNWLADTRMLPARFPIARIFTCDWPAGLFKEKSTIQMTVKELARSLLLGIRSRPGADKGRPILFIASCLGGLILIQAMVIAAEPGSEYTSLWRATGGVVFLATPFRGTAFQDIARAAILFLEVPARLAGETVSDLLDNLKASTPFLQDLVGDFTRTYKQRDQPCQLAIFYETKPGNLLRKGIPYRRSADYLKEPKLLVDSGSARLDIVPNPIALERAHVEMNKFSGPNDPDFHAVAGRIDIILGDIRNGYPMDEADALISSLPVAHEAAFDSHAEEHNARCHPDTRAELLCQIRQWADDPHGESVFWLNGMAGTGKSTISRTVAKSFADDGRLGASFFFKKGEGDRGKATLFFPTIAGQLVHRIPALRRFVREAIDADAAIARKALKDQFEKLIIEPIGHVHHVTATMIVVDALDECDGEKDVGTIISLLAQAKALSPMRLRIFITSRPELPIRLGFKNVQGKYQDLALHQIPEPIVERDISAFLAHELARIRDDYNSQALEGLELPLDWPDDDVIRSLAQMAVPLFIFAATVCRFVHDKGRSNPTNRLKKVLEYRMATHASRLDKLDTTYLPVLNQLTFERTDQDKADLLAEFRDVVGPIVLLAQPLSVRSLARLLNTKAEDIHCQLNSLHSVLSVPQTIDAPVRLFHLSFRDFLVDPTKRAKEFWIDETQYHQKLADRCIQLLHQYLRRDICGLQVPGKLRSEVDQRTIDAALPPEAQYACQYWVHHLRESKCSLRDGSPVHNLLKSHLLHWLESLSLLGRISESVGMVDDLLALSPANAIEISGFFRDIRRVVLSSWSIIDIAPLQVYASALVFSPARSITRCLFRQEERRWITTVPVVEDDWNACWQTMEHSDYVNSVAFSPDSKLVASGSYDKTVKIWDAATGICTQTLEGHSDCVRSVAFSPDSKLVASGSHDETVKIWDAATGICTQTLEGHSDWVSSVAFSPDSKLVASGSHDKTVKIWDAATGICTQTLEGHSHSVDFSTLLTSWSDDAKSPTHQDYGIGSDGKWIMRGLENWLWLPSGSRPGCSAVAASTIAIGCSSGRVLIMTFPAVS